MIREENTWRKNGLATEDDLRDSGRNYGFSSDDEFYWLSWHAAAVKASVVQFYSTRVLCDEWTVKKGAEKLKFEELKF